MGKSKATATATVDTYKFVRSDKGEQIELGTFAPNVPIVTIPKRPGESYGAYGARIQEYRNRLSESLANDATLLAALCKARGESGYTVSKIVPSQALIAGESGAKANIWVSFAKVGSPDSAAKATARRDSLMAERNVYATMVLQAASRLQAASKGKAPDLSDYFAARSFVDSLATSIAELGATLASDYRKAESAYNRAVDAFLATPAPLQSQAKRKLDTMARNLESLRERCNVLGVKVD
jgi:hypothetical protein